MRRLWCWVVGHRWSVTHTDIPRTLALINLHPMAGCIADCGRCGAHWDDISPSAREYFKAQGSL